MSSNCVKGMNTEEIFMELAKDDMGKCNGCEHLLYNAYRGMLECTKIGKNEEN